MQQVGTITAVAFYPVKSMRGVRPTAAPLSLQGFVGDRQYAFVQTASRSAFPYLTGRECPDLFQFQPWIDSTDAQRPKVIVTTPDGRSLPVDSDELRRELEQRADRPLFLLRDYRGSPDVAPVSLIGEATVGAVDAQVAVPVEPERFRANLYVECADRTPFAEDAWIGDTLRIGTAARVAVTEADSRCVMVTRHPGTGAATPEVLATVARLHANTAGVYGTVLAPGTVATGDPIVIE